MEVAMLALKVRKVGNSLGVVLPREAAARLRAEEGTMVYLTEAPDGGYRLTPYDETFAEQMAVAERVMREDRDVLRELARR
jgi:putative addiction module antidote